ncbi:MAG: AAA family ATPase [Oceanospirillaceae bacterium]|nr:AAA family ATPase [Oceanospirillaceae bacterium]
MNNQSIKFLSVTIRNFRGVPDELVIPLDAPLTVIHAANGTGKSTICYALEWLLTGRVEDLRNTTNFACQWGEGATSVSATCLIGEHLHELTREGRTVWISKNDTRRTRIKESNLLEMLTPSSVSGRTAQAISKAKRGWLRNSRWLYSNSLSLLVDNNKAEERQQIFADILGLGHITSTLRELRDYRKELPSIKGLEESFIRLSAEISELEAKLAKNSPWKERATSQLSKILFDFPQAEMFGTLKDDFKTAQFQVRVLEKDVQSHLGIFRFLSDQWEQYSVGQSQLKTLRQTLVSLLETSETLSKEHSKLSADLSNAEVKAAEGTRCVSWAKERFDILSQWELITSEPSIHDYFSSGNVSEIRIEQQFVEFSWSSEKQEAWLQSISYLTQHAGFLLDLIREKQDLVANVVQPPADIVNINRQVELAKSARVKAESEFNALSSIVDKLRAIGRDIVHSHESGHCPLCNHDWESNDKLRKQLAGENILTPELNAATINLSEAREFERECIEKLTLANSQKASYDNYISRLRSINGELDTIAQRTKYLEVMGVSDFSKFNSDNLLYLDSRVRSAIELRKIFDSLTEVEAFFETDSAEGSVLRLSTARENLTSYMDYYQGRSNQANLEKLRLAPLVQGAIEKIQAKSREIDGLNSNIAAISQTVDHFENHWSEVVGKDPIVLDNYNTALEKVEANRARVDVYKTMLAECEAVVAIESDSEQLAKLKYEKDELSKKLEAGRNYITEADRTIDRYTLHVRELTTSSLAPLLGPAAELFSRMHANEVYQGLGVSEGDEALRWTVFAEGHDFALDAEEKFSQGQRQDLALSLYLARARNTGGSFFLDEPIAHLDDLNRVAMLDIFRLVATSMPNINLILTTASDGLARHMAQKFSSITDRHLLSTIQLEGNPRTGVKMLVTKNVPG